MILAAWLCLAADVGAESIWIEGEDSQNKQVTRHSWYDSVKQDVLSGQEWLSHFDPGKPGLAGFSFQAVRSGGYAFWVRANHVKSSLAYRLNGGDWRQIAMDRNQRGAMNIARDNKPDLRFVAWVNVGRVQLQKGANEIEFRMDSEVQNHGAIDCFCLTTDRWTPSGAARPSAEPIAAGPGDWFPLVLDEDPLSPQSVIDMSRLIEAPAGQHGFLKAEGDRLRFENAEEPVKFWGVNASPRDMTPEEMRQACALVSQARRQPGPPTHRARRGWLDGRQRPLRPSAAGSLRSLVRSDQRTGHLYDVVGHLPSSRAVSAETRRL